MTTYDMEVLMHFLESLNFLQVLTLILIALLFGKDTIVPWIGEKFFGVLRKDKDTLAQPEARGASLRIEKKMDQLQLHFNHETTDLLKAIADNTGKTLSKLEEFEKYGIPYRDKK